MSSDPALTPEVLEELTKLDVAYRNEVRQSLNGDNLLAMDRTRSNLIAAALPILPAILAAAQRVQELEKDLGAHVAELAAIDDALGPLTEATRQAQVRGLVEDRDEIEEIVPVAQGSYQTIVERVRLLRYQRDHLSEGERLRFVECGRLQDKVDALETDQRNTVRWCKEAFGPDAPGWAKDYTNADQAATCADCGAWLTSVRPGKYQCDVCPHLAARQAEKETTR